MTPKRVNKIIIILLIFCISQMSAYAAFEDNISIIRRQDSEVCRELSSKLSGLKFSSVDVSGHSSRALFVRCVREILTSDGILVDSINSLPALEITISDNNVYYDAYINSDSVSRRVKTSIIYLSDKLSGGISREFADTVAINSIQYLERGENQFAKGVLPQESKPWYDEYITPIIVFGASILSAVLFFSVRSK